MGPQQYREPYEMWQAVHFPAHFLGPPAAYGRDASRRMDSDKRAAVKAGVFDMYERNSKTGKKKLPTSIAGQKRKNQSTPDDEEIEKAREEIDGEERYSQAVRCSIRPDHKEPALVKQQIKAYQASHDLTETSLCKEVGMELTDFQSFLSLKKKNDMYRSKAYHAAKKFLGCPDLGDMLDKENRSPPPMQQDVQVVRRATRKRRRGAT